MPRCGCSTVRPPSGWTPVTVQVWRFRTRSPSLGAQGRVVAAGGDLVAGVGAGAVAQRDAVDLSGGGCRWISWLIALAVSAFVVVIATRPSSVDVALVGAGDLVGDERGVGGVDAAWAT